MGPGAGPLLRHARRTQKCLEHRRYCSERTLPQPGNKTSPNKLRVRPPWTSRNKSASLVRRDCWAFPSVVSSRLDRLITTTASPNQTVYSHTVSQERSDWCISNTKDRRFYLWTFPATADTSCKNWLIRTWGLKAFKIVPRYLSSITSWTFWQADLSFGF